MKLKTVRLEMARNPGYPDGDSACGYELNAPLDTDGRIDLASFQRQRSSCKVRRFWRDEQDKVGELHHTRHGTWAFSYVPGEEDDEPLFRLESHSLRKGEYVTVREQNGDAITFRVANVD
jgi:hypothetical protein